MISRNIGASFENAKFNNRLAFLINSLSVLLLLFCGINYIVKNWFTVNKIIIEGQIKHITPVQLSYIAQNKLHGTFFTLDIDELKRKFLEIPWVYQVSVKRHFPHTIVVNIEEYDAVARIGDSLLATNGVVFDGADDNINLPIFYADITKASSVLVSYQKLENLVQKHNQQINRLWLNLPQITRFSTNQGLMVTICGNDISTQLSLLDKYWQKLYDINPKLSSINLCYKNALAINSPMVIESPVISAKLPKVVITEKNNHLGVIKNEH